MEVLELRTDDIQQELAGHGQVVRRKAGEVSDEAIDMADALALPGNILN